MYLVPFGVKKDTPIKCEHATKALVCTMASICGDEATFRMLTEEADPLKCRELCRGCQGFDQAVWDEKLKEVLWEVLWCKFGSDDDLESCLLLTGDAVIAYASTDPKWGIGIPENDPRLQSPGEWLGENIQGTTLAKVRQRLRRYSHI